MNYNVPFPAKSEFLECEHFDVRTHNGFVTILSPSGDHRTFHISTSRGKDSARFVSLLIGPDRTDPRSWLSFALGTSDGVVLFRKYANKCEISKKHKLPQMTDMLNKPEYFRRLGVTYLHAGRCRVCNRPLTNPASIRDGIGPECNKHSV